METSAQCKYCNEYPALRISPRESQCTKNNIIPEEFQDFSNQSYSRCPESKGDPLPRQQFDGKYSENANPTCELCTEEENEDLKSYVPKYGLLRHSLQEMRNLTIAKENAAADVFANAEGSRVEGNRVKREVADKVIGLQRISTDRLKHRANDIYALRTQLEHEIREMRDETSLLEELRIRTDNAIRATADIILHIGNECLRRRLSRIGIDLTYDDVEVELQKERELLLQTQKTLEEFAAKVRNQIGRNRAAKEELEKDWSKKVEAFGIDDLAAQLQADNPTVVNYAGVARFQEGMSSVEQWEEFTRKNLEGAGIERSASMKLRKIGPDLLEKSAGKLRSQADSVESAMTRTISEIESAKARLMHQLKLVLEEMVKTEDSIASTKKAMRGDPIESALRLAQTRLYNRTSRPGIELTRDVPQSALIQEVHEINRSQTAFEAQLQNAMDTLHKLHSTRIDLEKEIAVKDNTLVICRERCQYVRTFWPSVVTLSGN